MSRQDTLFNLRLPSDLKEFVRESAARNERSITGEIVYVLRQNQEKTTTVHQA